MHKLMIVLMAGVLAACAGGAEQVRDRLDRLAVYESHAGDAESWVRYTSIRNWRAVGFRSLVFELDRSRHYLVELDGGCNLDFAMGPVIRLVSSRRNVLSEFDKIIVDKRTCRILSLRPLDHEAVRAELDSESRPEAEGRIRIESDDQPSGGT